jgi:DNA repair exonuclease SbcCD nuclease subunit
LRFVHFADVHLGNRQYGLNERVKDFAVAYRDAINYCETVCPDFVLLAGDLFESSTVDPSTLLVAMKGLERLRKKDIPVFAIEGNHDKPARQGVSNWLWFLGQEGFIHLLDIAPAKDGGFQISRWDPKSRRGTYVDFEGVRIFGIGYYGARLPGIVSNFADQAKDISTDGIHHSLCMLHTGIDDVVEYNQSGATASSLSPLRDLIDYAALGHIHHRFEIPQDGHSPPWIFNPGSFETCSAAEAGREKGLYDVVLSDADNTFKATHVSGPIFRRPYYRFEIQIDDLSTPEELEIGIASHVSTSIESCQVPPIVAITLKGTLQFERALFDASELQTIIADKFDCLHVQVRLETQSQGGHSLSAVGPGKTRQQIEKDVLVTHFEAFAESSPHANKLADLAIQIRRDSVAGSSADAILETLEGELQHFAEIHPSRTQEDLDAAREP